MEANPWAVVVFFLVGVPLLGPAFTNPLALSVYFVVFVIVWFAAGCLWDAIRYRRK